MYRTLNKPIGFITDIASGECLIGNLRHIWDPSIHETHSLHSVSVQNAALRDDLGSERECENVVPLSLASFQQYV